MKFISKIFIPVIFIVLITGELSFGQIDEAPPSSIAKSIIKLAALENHLNSIGDLSIYVLDAPEVGEELKNRKGEKIGESSLRAISISNELPAFKVSMLYIGDPSKLDEAIKYTRENGVLSITGLPDLIGKGVTLGIGMDNEQKTIAILNMVASKAEKLDWNPAIKKIAKVVE